MPARQESKRSYSLLMHSCWAGLTNNQTVKPSLNLGFWNERESLDWYFDHANGELVARVFPPDMFTLQMICILDQLFGFSQIAGFHWIEVWFFVWDQHLLFSFLNSCCEMSFKRIHINFATVTSSRTRNSIFCVKVFEVRYHGWCNRGSEWTVRM